jgi:hypothetical protein
MPNAIKIHVYHGPDNGAIDCDFRNPDGSEEATAATGDEHKTVFEIDPATDEEVALVLELGPKLNALFAKGNPVGGFAGLRIGVWPGDGRA